MAQKNYPDTKQLGDVTQIDGCHIGIISNGIDLLIGGSPCQDLSIANKNRKGLDGGGQGDRVYSITGKSVALSANGGGRGAKTGLYAVKDFVRKLTPMECERLQSLPDNWTEGISNTQRYKCLGNAFNVEVVAHILKGLAH